jgi:membrane protein DedA with SNARE-associated domain
VVQAAKDLIWEYEAMSQRHSFSRLRKQLRLTRQHLALLPVVSVALVLLAVAVLEGDLPEEFGDVTSWVGVLLQRYGAGASLLLLYVEESGVPMPVPGDVFVIYLGVLTHGSIAKWLLAWVAVVLVAVLGSSNLYLLARRFGPRLVNTRLGALLRVDERRRRRAERWFGRWGVLAIIFGRHIPGFRIPISVVAGVLGFPYRAFAPSVAVSTAVWSGTWLWLGARYGASVAGFFTRNHWSLVVAGAVIVLGFAIVIVYAWRAAGELAGGGEAVPIRS